MRGVEGESAREKADRGCGLLVVKNLNVSQASGIVDADMHELPAGRAAAPTLTAVDVLARTVPSHAMPGAEDPGEASAGVKGAPRPRACVAYALARMTPTVQAPTPPSPARSRRLMRRYAAVLVAAALALGATACGSTVSTGSFKGAQHEVAQTLSDLQSDATSGDQAKICDNDLTAAAIARLGGRSGCEAAIKTQLGQTDNFELSVQSIKIAPGGKTATATVKSVYNGKKRTGTITLAKEGGRWKVTSL